MTDALRHVLSIGGIRFCVSSAEPIVNDQLDPAYASFLSVPADAPPPSRNIAVHVHATPDLILPPGDKVFDSESSWSMYLDGKDRWIARTSTHYDEPFWTARMPPSFDTIDIHCGQRFLNRQNGERVIINPLRYPLDQLLLMYALAHTQGLLVHAAGLLIGGQAFVFPGTSGAGKSTLSRCIGEKDDARIISDDRVIIRPGPDGYLVYGTPWPGEFGAARNTSAPLGGIYFIEKAAENAVTPLALKKRLPRLLPVVSIPWYDSHVMTALLGSAGALVNTVPTGIFAFTPGHGLYDFLLNATGSGAARLGG